MSIYTVHQPPLKRYETSSDPERFVFVREGFSFWAFLFGPLWMLRHRMWLVLVGYVVVVAATIGVLRLAGGTGGVSYVAGFLLALLIGIEASTLLRFSLGRRGFHNFGVVVGDGREDAERRFFDSWVRGETLAPPSPAEAGAPKGFGSPTLRRPAASSEIVGLFPQSGAPR